MAQYNTTTGALTDDISNSHGQEIVEIIADFLGADLDNTNPSDLLSNGDAAETPVTTYKARTIEDAQQSDADVLLINLDEDNRGTAESPLQFNDPDSVNNENGGRRAYVFEGDTGVTAVFNTVEQVQVIVGTSSDDTFTIQGNQNTTVAGGEGNDTITSSDGHDSITSGIGNDSISSGAGNDTIASGIGNDSISSGTGNDSIYGGSGEDSVHFSGNRADYTVSQNGAITMVSNNDTGDTTSVVNAEILNFADRELTINPTDEMTVLVTLYSQMFGDSTTRPDGQADLDGLQYWSNQIDSGELTLGGVIQSMLSSQESASNLDALDMKSAADRKTAVDLLFTKLLDRAADAEGRDYWLDALENGTTLQDVAQAISDSDEFQNIFIVDTNWDFII